ncbi:hypothetical protein Tco_0666161 [Tanacetum coccineum]
MNPTSKEEEVYSKKDNKEETKAGSNTEKKSNQTFLDIVPREEDPIDIESFINKVPYCILGRQLCWTETFSTIKSSEVMESQGEKKKKVKKKKENYKILRKCMKTLTEWMVEELYRLVKERYISTAPEGFDLMLCSGSRRQDTILGDRPTQTRFERLSKQSNDLPLSRVNTLRSGEDRMKLNELMEICTKFSDRVLDLENVKTAQDLEITSLKKRVKKLEKKKKTRTPQLKRRLFKVRIKSSADKSLGDQENASKQRRNEEDEDISWFQDDAKTLGRYDQDIDVTTTNAPITTPDVSVSTAEPSTLPTTTMLETRKVSVTSKL